MWICVHSGEGEGRGGEGERISFIIGLEHDTQSHNFVFVPLFAWNIYLVPASGSNNTKIPCVLTNVLNKYILFIYIIYIYIHTYNLTR